MSLIDEANKILESAQKNEGKEDITKYRVYSYDIRDGWSILGHYGDEYSAKQVYDAWVLRLKRGNGTYGVFRDVKLVKPGQRFKPSKLESMPPKSRRKRIETEDDLVKVYQGNKEIYSGTEDYEPMNDADWRWDNNDKCYKYDKYVKICFESAKLEMMTSELPKDYMPIIKKELGNEVKLVQVDHGDKCDRAGVIVAHNKSSNKFSLYVRNRFRKGDKLSGTWTQLIQKRGYDVYNAVKGKEKPELTDSIVREILDYWLSLMKRYDRSGEYRTDYSDQRAEVRYWGSWEGDDGSGDYDWQHLTDEWDEKLYKVRQDVKKKFPAFANNISISTEEKNWICCSIWPKR